MENLNELYIGKGPILPIEKQLGKMRNVLKNKPVTTTTNLDPEIIKFNRLCEKLFGFHRFMFYVQPSYMYNAYAFPVDTFFSQDEKDKLYRSMVSGSTGFKYNNAFACASLVFACNSQLLFDTENFSDAEIMAVLLHEIGHGFFEAVTSPVSNVTYARKMISVLSSVQSFIMDKIKNGKQITSDIVNKELAVFNPTIDIIKKKVFGLKSVFFREAMSQNMKRSRIAYTNEKFADTFASTYGYGVEIHTALDKIPRLEINKLHKNESVKQYSKLEEFLGKYSLLFNDYLNYIFNCQDEHPETLARIKTTCDYLKHELAKEGLDPALKADLLEQLQKSEKLIDDIINVPKDQDCMRIYRLYMIELYKKFGGDRRESDTDNDALFDTIDQKYNDMKG